MIIKSDEIFLENEIIPGYLSIGDGYIKDILTEGQADIDLTGLKVLPGFIDIHVHGGNGFDTMDAEYEAIDAISRYKIEEGVTSFCPTTVTAPEPKIMKALKNIAEAKQRGVSGAKIIGGFLEGPYIDKEFKGAHPEEFIVDIDLVGLQKYIDTGAIKSVAIAPNLDNAYDAIKFCKARGIDVRIGHSGADCGQVQEAIKYGANIAIHTYNAMTGLSHRSPGFVGETLVNDGIYNEIICDLIHVSKRAIQVLVKCKRDKVVLITDCMEAGGLPEGVYKLGELEVVVKDNVVRLAEGGSLAGSTLSVISAVKNMNKIIGVPLFQAVKMAAQNPAKALGIYDEIGSLAVGKKADLIAIDDDFNVKFVMVDGKVIKAV
ncbi:MAG: N-acetylglucosamine-6-phosphate deacetylase [Clostridiales bacterium]|jgi:N-acetylglucosamine-6-phosphate deacetylase|nr:N-acetylglucosamine-6-phosphate deacetylase [Clostridiales bacterium]